jgi:hypothetical protein
MALLLRRVIYPLLGRYVWKRLLRRYNARRLISR